MAKLRPYIALYRVAFGAESDLLADQQAEFLKARIEEHLEDDETARVTQVAGAGEPLHQDEALARLRLARNELIRLRYKDAMYVAQEVDKIIWKLRGQVGDDDPLPNDYNYNRVSEILQALDRGENPLY